MRNAFMEAKCNARNFKLPEEIGLRLPRKTFAAFTYTENMGDISKDYWGAVPLQIVLCPRKFVSNI